MLYTVAWLQWFSRKNNHSSTRATWKNAKNNPLLKSCILLCKLKKFKVMKLPFGSEGCGRGPRLAGVRQLSACVLVRKVWILGVICTAVCSGLLLIAVLYVAFFQRKLCTHFWLFLSLCLQSFTAGMQGECEVVVMHFARQWFFILLQKKDQLCKARLNHSFHFLMGFGWIE